MADHFSITVTAHRGFSTVAPENTMAAFQRALDLGVSAIETDIRLTRDGVAVLIHDEDLVRTANLEADVAELTLAEIQQVAVNAEWDEAFAGETVPSLQQLAERCRDLAMLLLDLKVDGAAAPIASALARAGMPQEQVAICTWSMRQAADARIHLPDCQLLYIEQPLLRADAQWLHAMATHGFDGLSLHYDDISESLVARAHDHDLTVFTWTVDDEATAQATLRTGVDGIITSDPAMLIAACRDTLQT